MEKTGDVTGYEKKIPYFAFYKDTKECFQLWSLII